MRSQQPLTLDVVRRKGTLNPRKTTVYIQREGSTLIAPAAVNPITILLPVMSCHGGLVEYDDNHPCRKVRKTIHADHTCFQVENGDAVHACVPPK